MRELKNPEAAAAAHAFVKAILFYGGVTFVAGFFFGALRELVFIPLAGNRAGHWIEFPLMLAATAAIAFFAVKRLPDPSRRKLLQLGIAGTLLLLLIEGAFALYVLRVPMEKYLASFDVSAGQLFPFGLLFMCIAPYAIHLVGRRSQ